MCSSTIFAIFVSVKQQVTDISKVLEELQKLNSKVEGQATKIANMSRTIQHLQKDNRDLRKQIKKKDKEISRLNKRLSKYEDTDEPDNNSTNSSTPPSKEKMKDEVVRRTQSLRKPTGNNPGGQPGHPGSTLKLAPDADIERENVAEVCPECGDSLDGCEKELDYVTQIISLPELKPVITQIKHYVMVCRTCGSRVKAVGERRKSNAVTYDASVKALAVYLSVVQFLPYGRIKAFYKEAFGLDISQGSIDNWMKEAKRAAAPAIEKIREYIMSSAVVGFDETGCYCNKKLDWAWIAQTVYFTLVFRGSGRSSKELEDRFGDALERMIAVTDRHSAYFALDFLDHQVCLAHLLRECKYLNELVPTQDWSGRVEILFQEAIHERNQNPGKVIDKKPWLDRLKALLDENLSKLKDKFVTFQNGLIKCQDYIFNFLSNPTVPPDNNASERGIRKLKIKLKNSGCFRSELGADAFMELHSIIETTKKHGNSPYQAILTLFGA